MPPALASELEYVGVADQVRLDVGAGILEAVANACLCPKMHDRIDPDRVGELPQRLCVGKIELLETETIVEAALSILSERRDAPLRILDLGIGSGALLCALLTEFGVASGIGVDSSADAAELDRLRAAGVDVVVVDVPERAETRLSMNGPGDKHA